MKKRMVEIGDVVALENTNTYRINIYYIIQVHYEPKIISSNLIDGVSRPVYRNEQIEELDHDSGELSSDSELAKNLIGKQLGEIVSFPDENEILTKYKIIGIKKYLGDKK